MNSITFGHRVSNKVSCLKNLDLSTYLLVSLVLRLQVYSSAVEQEYLASNSYHIQLVLQVLGIFSSITLTDDLVAEVQPRLPSQGRKSGSFGLSKELLQSKKHVSLGICFNHSLSSSSETSQRCRQRVCQDS